MPLLPLKDLFRNYKLGFDVSLQDIKTAIETLKPQLFT